MNKLSLYVIFILFLLAVLLTSPTRANADTEVLDDISINTQWTVTGSPYVVGLPIMVASGATLTIDPGVVVKFDSAGSLNIEGVLQANGTVSDQIYFTSFSDDSVGGDTNGDGSISTPEFSDWQGIIFSNSIGSSNISNIEVRFANFGVENFNSNISISDSKLKNLNSGIISFGGSTTISNTSIDEIEQTAISLFDNNVTNIDNISIENIDEFGEGVTIFENSKLVLNNSSLSGSVNNSGVLLFEGGELYIDESIISGFSMGVADYGSGNFGGDYINIKNSQIKNNNVGVSLYADDTDLKISGNTIHNNNLYGVQSFAKFSANFKNNFWGDATGPYNEDTNSTGLGNAIFYIPSYNNVLFSPWLATWPSEPAPCCSSVIFVPGFEGSRLYEKKNNGSLTQRWEAGVGSLTDVKSLFLDDNGNSIKNNIVTKDIIERTNYSPDFFNKNVYKSISDWLRNNKVNQNIKDFLLYSYDWRLDVENIAQNGVQTDTELIKLKDKVISLSQDSKTEKVTLIGHSNGGLLIKKIVELLEESGQANLVDKVLLVASPQLGTPSAFTAMLHGDDTSLGLGLILQPETARTWAKSMPGVYGLLPSERLYQKIGSFINFESPVMNNWINLYGDTLDYSEQTNFLTGGDGRKQPKDNDLDNPTVLNQSILNKSIGLHNSIDNLEFPANMEVYEIAGTGRRTLQGVTYTNSFFGIGSLEHKPKISCNGDKTVIPESAVDKNQNPYYLDLYDYYKDGGNEFSHSNIMENPEVISLISNIITDSSENTPHITFSKPTMSKCRFKIFGMFSPADLDLYDNQGRHLGVNREQSTNNFKVFDTQIPGSDFFTIGDKKFATVPDEGEYTVKIDGTGTGLYTLDITTQENDQIVNETSFNDLPVTPALKGSVIIDTQSQNEPVLSIDTNGDGTVDQEVTPNNGASPLSYLEVIRVTILELELSKKLEKSLLQQIDRVITLVKKNKLDKATDNLQKFLKRIDIGHKIAKEMTQAERDDLANKINTFLSSL